MTEKMKEACDNNKVWAPVVTDLSKLQNYMPLETGLSRFNNKITYMPLVLTLSA